MSQPGSRPMKPATALPLVSSLLLLGLGTTACQGADQPQPGPEQPELDESGLPFSESRDSAGVRIIENPRPAESSRLGWRIGPEPSVTIGAVEGVRRHVGHPPGDVEWSGRGAGRIRGAEGG